MLRNNVGKDKIASDLSEEFGFSNRYSKEILDDFIEIIKNELLEKKILNLLNFSTFRIKFSMHVTANWTSGHTVSGTSSYKKSGFQFIRVGDT